MLGVLFRVNGSELMSQNIEVGFGLRDRYAWFEVRQDVPVDGRLQGIFRESVPRILRHPYVGATKGKARRHDADERAGCSAKQERFVENLWVAVEVLEPRFVAQYKDWRSTGLVIGGLQSAALQ